MRLIDCEPLKADLLESKEKLWEIYNGLSHHVDKQICAGEIATFQETIMRINEAPAIDAEPVKHGRWLQPKPGECFCSECQTNGSPQWKRCPVCEAKMDGE